MKTAVAGGDQVGMRDSKERMSSNLRHPNTASARKTSLAAIFCGQSGKFQMEQVPTPAPNVGEVMVRIDGCLLSRRSLDGFDSVCNPNIRRIFGNETCGTIEAFGPDTVRLDSFGHPIDIGSRIVWSSSSSCGECFCCRQGLPANCLRSSRYGKLICQDDRVLFGGLAEHAILKSGTCLLAVDADMPIGIAAQIPGAAACAAAVLNAGEQISGQRVVIIGAGLTGITLAAMALSSNADRVILVEHLGARRQIVNSLPTLRCIAVHEMGAEVSRMTDGYGADVVFDVSGDPRTPEIILSLVRLGGRIVFHRYHSHAKRRSFCLSQIASQNVSIRGVDGYRAEHMQQAHGFLASNHMKFRVGSLVHEWNPLVDAERAAHAALDMKWIRIGVTPSVHFS